MCIIVKVKDESGDENDGMDETIYPLDHDQYEGTSGQIIDDVRRNLLLIIDNEYIIATNYILIK